MTEKPRQLLTDTQQQGVGRALATVLACAEEIRFHLPKRTVAATRVRLRHLLNDAAYALEQLRDPEEQV